MVLPIYPRLVRRRAKGKDYYYYEYRIVINDGLARGLLLSMDEAVLLEDLLRSAIIWLKNSIETEERLMGRPTETTIKEREQIKLAKEIIEILKNYDVNEVRREKEREGRRKEEKVDFERLESILKTLDEKEKKHKELLEKNKELLKKMEEISIDIKARLKQLEGEQNKE